MTAEPLTTLKVPKQLRERIASGAAARGLTSAGYLFAVLEVQERRDRFAAVRRAYAGGVDENYAAEVDDWDRLAGDGLEE